MIKIKLSAEQRIHPDSEQQARRVPISLGRSGPGADLLKPKGASPLPIGHAEAGPTPSMGSAADTIRTARSVARLQKTHGNARIGRLYRYGFQAKFSVGSEDDAYEREADRMADAVMRTPIRQQRPVRVAAPGIQAKGRFDTTPEVSPELETYLHASRRAGQPLSNTVRGSIEGRFEQDFSQVRLHTDARAASATASLNARAFTSGQDIYFGEGQYRPDTTEGQRLLAHELTHTIQQAGNVVSRVPNQPKRPLGDIDFSEANPGVLRRSPGRPSHVIPHLDASTVSDLETLVRMGIGAPVRQRAIDSIVRDRTAKGTDFTIMDGDKPRYVATFPATLLQQGLSPQANGVTIAPNSPPVNATTKPLVLIGPHAFGTSRDPINERLVRLYSTIMHEYRHVQQWQQPARARAMGATRREVDAFFWEIENSRRTGLFAQPGAFQDVWAETLNCWSIFVNSSSWMNLTMRERMVYARRYGRATDIVIAALGRRGIAAAGQAVRAGRVGACRRRP